VAGNRRVEQDAFRSACVGGFQSYGKPGLRWFENPESRGSGVPGRWGSGNPGSRGTEVPGNPGAGAQAVRESWHPGRRRSEYP
jgi:hypothetical protein